jgi:hypothetical protein
MLFILISDINSVNRDSNVTVIVYVTVSLQVLFDLDAPLMLRVTNNNSSVPVG